MIIAQISAVYKGRRGPFFIFSAGTADKKPAGPQKQSRRSLSFRFDPENQSFVARYRKVTTWPLVQVASGPKAVSLRPLVTSFSTAQATAFK